MKRVNNEEKTIQLFLLLDGQAEMWYLSLSKDTQGNYENLRAAFVARFLPCEADRIVNVTRFRGLKQMKEESSDDFIEKVIRMGGDLQKSEQEIIHQVYQGLTPGIMKLVAQKAAKTLDDVRRFARLVQLLEIETDEKEMCRIQEQREKAQNGKCDFQYANSSERNRYQSKRCYICSHKSHLARDCWFRYGKK